MSSMAQAETEDSMPRNTFKPHKNVVGIDLGTTNIVAFIQKAGNMTSEELIFDNGKRIMPSYVQANPKLEGNWENIGARAEKSSNRAPEYVLYDAKRMIGRSFTSDLLLYKPYWSFNIGESKVHKNRPAYILPNKNEVLPEEVSTALLREVRRVALNHCGDGAQDEDTKLACVITVPAYFENHQKLATEDAAKNAGLNVLSLLSEPVAAALAYGFEHKKFDGFKLFVVDLGGGTMDATVIKYSENQFTTIALGGDSKLGGRDFDNCLFMYLEETQKLNLKKKSAENLKMKVSLRVKCEEIKKQLSDNDSAVYEGDDHRKIEITQELFRELSNSLLERIKVVCQNALNEANVEPSGIDKLLLVGGATRMRIFRDLIKSMFGTLYDESGANPDEAVAMGACLRAAHLMDLNKRETVLFTDCLPLSVGLGLSGNVFSVVVKRGTKFPSQVRKRYFTSTTNQESANIEIFEGERLLADKNTRLGQIQLKGLPKGPAGDVYVDVVFEFDANGILHVHAVSENGQEKRIQVNYKQVAGNAESLADLLRQVQNSRKDDESFVQSADSKQRLRQNVGHILERLDTVTVRASDKTKLKKMCASSLQALDEEQVNLESLAKNINELEVEASTIFSKQLLGTIA